MFTALYLYPKYLYQYRKKQKLYQCIPVSYHQFFHSIVHTFQHQLHVVLRDSDGLTSSFSRAASFLFSASSSPPPCTFLHSLNAYLRAFPAPGRGQRETPDSQRRAVNPSRSQRHLRFTSAKMDRDETVATQDVTGANLMLGLVSGEGGQRGCFVVK